MAPSAKSMGETAAADALGWLKAKPAVQAPPASQDTRYSVAVRAAALRARNISLPSIYLEAARLEQLYYPDPQPAHQGCVMGSRPVLRITGAAAAVVKKRIKRAGRLGAPWHRPRCRLKTP